MENNSNYKATIIEGATGLSKKEQLMFTDLTDCVSLDEATKESPVMIEDLGENCYALLEIHNEKSENVDYQVLIIIDKDGTRYRTGSQTFYSAFKLIYDMMNGSGETWGIKALRRPSKNYQGRDFLTCTVI